MGLKRAGSSWIPYTPLVTGAGWSLGNGIATGRYKLEGKTVRFALNIQFGTTSTFGAAAVQTSLPVLPIGSLYIAKGFGFNNANYFDLIGDIQVGNGGLILWTNGGTVTGGVTATSPFNWANGHQLRSSGEYEAA